MSLANLQKKMGIVSDGAFGPGTLKAAMAYYKLTPNRAAHFFAQTAHESGNFKAFSENLSYSADGLLKIFGKYFNPGNVTSYARQPEKIANRVYANRMGNGNEASGDGWKYRGRGALQLTGKDNYAAFAKYLNKPEIMTNPDLVATEYAFESAMFFFQKNNLWAICDSGVSDSTILAMTKKINGGTHGLADRKEKTIKYLGWSMSNAQPTKAAPPPAPAKPAAAPAKPTTKLPPDTVLSENFKLGEFIKSETAIRKGIDNSPSEEHLENLKLVCQKILEPVRKHFGKPIRINSGYRGPALNAAVGGSKTSQHCNGEAVDFEIDGLANPELAKWVAANCDFDQIILEFYDPKEGPNSGWVHASYTNKKPNRKQTMTASSAGGKTVYTPGFKI